MKFGYYYAEGMGVKKLGILKVLGLSAITITGISIGYSNCSQVKFSTSPSKGNVVEGITAVCDPNLRPDDTEFQPCPGDNAHQASRTRQVYCSATNTWSTGNFGNWDYSACVCPISGQTVNPATGVCECASGFYFDNQTNTCVQDNSGGCTGSPDIRQQDNNCPSGLGFRFRERTATCTNGSFVYTPAQWGPNTPPWIYTSCQCANTGENLDPLTGACACPVGQTVVNGACVTQVTCGPNTTEQVTLRACQVGNTYVNRTTSYTYVSATNSCAIETTDSAEQFDLCGCSISGQTLNQTDLSCNCPSGQQLVNGSCQTPVVCDPNSEPGPWSEVKACSSFTGAGFTPNPFSSGNATRERARAQCVNNAWTPNPLGDWGPWNFGACSCAISGQTVDAATGTCACPPNYAVFNNQCRLAVCTGDTTRTETESCSVAGTLLAASGDRTRTIAVQCINNGTGTQEGTPSAWNINACSCAAYAGTTFNTTTRACECPSNGTWNGTSCTPACNLTGPTTAACGGGATAGQYTRANACSAWNNNCSCPAGQNYVVTDGATPAGSCQCNDTNLSVFNGQCLPTVCAFSGSQTEVQFTGVNNCGYRSREVTCSNNGTSLVYGQWRNRAGTAIPTPNDRYDLSLCACASNQQHLPDIYSACSCPSNTVWNGASCVTPGTGCGVETTYSACPAQTGYNVSGQVATSCQKQLNSSGVCVLTSNCSVSNGCSYSCANNAQMPNCTSCLNGATPASNCTSCPAPQTMQNGTCQLCPSGTGYQLGVCANCPAGYSSSGANGAGFCSSCTGNTYSTGAQNASCSTCPAGTTANANHTGCVASEPVCSSSNVSNGGTYTLECSAANNTSNTCSVNISLLNGASSSSLTITNATILRWFNNGNNWSGENTAGDVSLSIVGSQLQLRVAQVRAVVQVTLAAGSGGSCSGNQSWSAPALSNPWCPAVSFFPEAPAGTRMSTNINQQSCFVCDPNAPQPSEGGCTQIHIPVEWECQNGVYSNWTQISCLPDPGSGGVE